MLSEEKVFTDEEREHLEVLKKQVKELKLSQLQANLDALGVGLGTEDTEPESPGGDG